MAPRRQLRQANIYNNVYMKKGANVIVCTGCQTYIKIILKMTQKINNDNICLTLDMKILDDSIQEGDHYELQFQDGI